MQSQSVVWPSRPGTWMEQQDQDVGLGTHLKNYFASCCSVCVTHRTLTRQKKKWPYCFYGRSLHIVKNNKLHMKKCYQMNNNKITLQLLFDMKSCMFPGPEEAITVPQSLRELDVNIDTAVLGLALCVQLIIYLIR